MSGLGTRDSVVALLLGALLLGATPLGATPLGAQPKAECVAVAARPLARGAVLAAEDIDAKGSTLCARRSTLLVGAVTRRVIAAGEALRAPAVAPPNAVAYGQPVAVVYRDGAIEVRLRGTALNAAPLGSRVSVRVDARRRLEGVVAAPGLVLLK